MFNSTIGHRPSGTCTLNTYIAIAHILLLLHGCGTSWTRRRARETEILLFGIASSASISGLDERTDVLTSAYAVVRRVPTSAIAQPQPCQVTPSSCGSVGPLSTCRLLSQLQFSHMHLGLLTPCDALVWPIA